MKLLLVILVLILSCCDGRYLGKDISNDKEVKYQLSRGRIVNCTKSNDQTMKPMLTSPKEFIEFAKERIKNMKPLIYLIYKPYIPNVNNTHLQTSATHSLSNKESSEIIPTTEMISSLLNYDGVRTTTSYSNEDITNFTSTTTNIPEDTSTTCAYSNDCDSSYDSTTPTTIIPNESTTEPGTTEEVFLFTDSGQVNNTDDNSVQDTTTEMDNELISTGESTTSATTNAYEDEQSTTSLPLETTTNIDNENSTNTYTTTEDIGDSTMESTIPSTTVFTESTTEPVTTQEILFYTDTSQNTTTGDDFADETTTQVYNEATSTEESIMSTTTNANTSEEPTTIFSSDMFLELTIEKMDEQLYSEENKNKNLQTETPQLPSNVQQSELITKEFNAEPIQFTYETDSMPVWDE